MTEILICGACGAMGKILAEELKNETDMRAACGVDSLAKANNGKIYADFSNIFEQIDVVIDFSSRVNIQARLDFAKTRKIPLVIGTTGLTADDTELIEAYSNSIPIFLDSNFSPAVFTLEKLAKEAAKRLVGFDVTIVETHRSGKKDSPSGTAKTLQKTIENAKKCGISVYSIRGGNMTGTHEIHFFGKDETLTLTHRAEDKKAFARGAIQAAKFLLKKRKGLFDMNDLYKKTLSE